MERPQATQKARDPDRDEVVGAVRQVRLSCYVVAIQWGNGVGGPDMALGAGVQVRVLGAASRHVGRKGPFG
jgi:hypothetical protein